MQHTTKQERAARAAKTRKLNKLIERNEQLQQEDLRQQLYNLTNESQRQELDEALYGAMTCIEDDYEEVVTAFYDTKVEDVKQALRTLLRTGFRAATILGYIESSEAPDVFYLSDYGLEVNPATILDEVLMEDEFMGSKQMTDAQKQERWDLSDTYVSLEVVKKFDLDDSGYPVPTGIDEQGNILFGEPFTNEATPADLAEASSVATNYL